MSLLSFGQRVFTEVRQLFDGLQKPLDGTQQSQQPSAWQRFGIFNFNQSSGSVATNDRVLLQLSGQIRAATENDGNQNKIGSLPSPKAIIIPLNEGKKQAGYDELSRRVTRAALEQNGIHPSNIEMEELMALPASKNLDMNGYLDKNWNFHDKPGLMPEAGTFKDINGKEVFGYKQTFSPKFQQSVIADYNRIKSDLALTPNKKAVLDMGMNERLVETVKIAYDKGYISQEIKEHLGSLTPEELATAFAVGGAIGIAAGSAEAAAILGPLGLSAGLAYSVKQMAEFNHIAQGAAKATNRDQLDKPAKDFGAWMGQLSKEGVLAIAGMAGAAVAPRVMPRVEQVITTKVSGVKEALMENKITNLGEPELVTPEGVRIKIANGKTPLEKVSDPLEMRARVGENSRRNVELHEKSSVNSNAGHTTEKHIGKSENWLRNRLKTDSTLEEGYASSFNNTESANRVQGRFVNRYRTEIGTWLKNPSRKPLRLDLDMKEPIGILVESGKAGHSVSTRARGILVKDDTEQGWHFLTSFPIK